VKWANWSLSARELRGQVEDHLEMALTGKQSSDQIAHLNALFRESEDRFRNMADHSPLMLWVTDESGACTYINRRWCEFTGQAPEQGAGLGWLQAVHPEDRARAEHAFQVANAKKESFRLEYRLQRHDRQYRWVIDSAAPRFADSGEFLGYIGSVIDIQERRESEDQLHRNREQLQLISDSVSALLSYVDTDRRYRMCNHAYQVWFGIAPESIIGKTMREVRRTSLGPINQFLVPRALIL
jgi:PAS domain S-box-containing protein